MSQSSQALWYSQRKRAASIRRAFTKPYRRERQRDPEEARLLRERGTPEHLIGPERDAFNLN